MTEEIARATALLEGTDDEIKNKANQHLMPLVRLRHPGAARSGDGPPPRTEHDMTIPDAIVTDFADWSNGCVAYDIGTDDLQNRPVFTILVR